MAKAATVEKKEKKPVYTIEGIAYWVKAHEVSDRSGKHEVNVGQLDTDATDQLEEQGIELNYQNTNPKIKKGYAEAGSDNDKGTFTIARTSEQYPPELYDGQGQRLPLSFRIGNGSRVRLHYTLYSWTYDGEPGVSPNFVALEILELKDMPRQEREDVTVEPSAQGFKFEGPVEQDVIDDNTDDVEIED